jgi:hypothetical protein
MPLSAELQAWFDAHARPIWEAYYALDLDAATAHYESARASADAESNPDLRLAKQLRLGSVWMFVQSEFDAAAFKQAYREVLRLCALEPAGPTSAALLPLTEALARLQADAQGIEPLQPLPLLKLLRDIPDETRGPNFWNLAAEWAFRHGDGQLLEEAYVFFTTQRPAVMADQMFARLRLMRALRDGNATEKDVLETIGRMEVLAQMWDFERLLRRECEQQGLLSEDVRAEIELKKHALEATGRHAPQKR